MCTQYNESINNEDTQNYVYLEQLSQEVIQHQYHHQIGCVCIEKLRRYYLWHMPSLLTRREFSGRKQYTYQGINVIIKYHFKGDIFLSVIFRRFKLISLNEDKMQSMLILMDHTVKPCQSSIVQYNKHPAKTELVFFAINITNRNCF
jgi:hypothetical protein